MKPSIYKITIFFILVVSTTFSQTRELVLKKSFKVHENTVLHIDFDNVTAEFKESTDNKIHLDYSIEFKKNSNEVKYKVFKGINAKAFKDNNIVSLDVKNSMYLGELHSMQVDVNSFTKLMKRFYKEKKKNEFLYKSKDSILNEISFSKGHSIDDYIEKTKIDKPKIDFGESNRKFIQRFIIHVPKTVKINLKANHSKVNFTYNLETSFTINAFKTQFKFKNIFAKENRIIASNGIFQAEKIQNGKIEFLDMSKVVLGEISNISLATETSKIEIGEIQENVDFTDFNSTLYFYNFSNNFSSFNFKGDYSKLNFYNVKGANYTMNVFGYNTALNMNDLKTTFGVSKNKKRYNILDKKIKEGTISEGNIAIELTNGILNLKE